MKYIALIPAAGVGSRFGSDMPKQYCSLAGKTVLEHTIGIFLRQQRIHHVGVMISPDDEYFDQMVKLESPKLSVYRVGGETRAHTVFNGLQILMVENKLRAEDMVVVHDAARCCLPSSALNRLLDAHSWTGAILGVPVADTVKRQNATQHIAETVPRHDLWLAQTPQMFQTDILLESLQDIDLKEITDEASAIEKLGIQPKLILGDNRNMKLTRPDDAALMTYFLENGVQFD